MQKIRIAQIGTSRYSHGKDIFASLLSHPEVFEVVGYALPNGERERFPDGMSVFERSREMTVEEILADPTIRAVTVETEELFLTQYATLAAEAGKHIHMEKPGGLSLADFERLIQTVKRKELVFHTGYMYRYNPAIEALIQRARQGEIGEIISVEAQMSGWHDKACTEWLSCFEGGVMFFLGCHMVDLILRIQGTPDAVIPCNRSSGRFAGVDSKDNTFAVLQYGSGASFVKVSSAECGGYARRNLVITGTRGRFEIRPLEVQVNYPTQYTAYSVCTDTAWCADPVFSRSEDYHRYDDMLLSFAQMVRGERSNPFSYDYEWELFQTLKKCCE